jgi:murein DD-endopeptidase MepM/ murein hydrolase activator NlpD
MRLRTVLLLIVGAAPVAGVTFGAAGTEPSAPALGVSPLGAVEDPVEAVVLALETEHRAAEREQRALHERERLSVARTIAFGRAYVRATRAGLLPIAGGFADFVDHASRLERLRRAAERELAEQRAIVRDRDALALRLRDLDSRLAVARANRDTMARAQTALLAARDRELAFRRAFEGGPGAAVVYGPSAGPLDPTLGASGFGATQGRLPFPVAGRTVMQVARRPGIQGPGVDVRAPSGATVRAVFPGRVAFADEYAAYGRTVIIDHGDRYFSVSAALGGITVQVGDEVAGGAQLGTVAPDGEGGSMYFEIRHGAETVDAADWLGI